MGGKRNLPTCLAYARDVSGIRKFPKANATQAKRAHKAAPPAAPKTTPHGTGAEFGFFTRAGDNRFLRHDNIYAVSLRNGTPRLR